MITYNSIIQYFEAITSSHQQIKSFTYGEIDFLDKDKFTQYPALHLTPTSSEIADQTITYGFEVVVFDRYDGDNNKMVNEAISLSDSLLILQDLCKELSEGKYFINEDTLIDLQLPISATPFIDTKPDICSGWSTSFSISTPNESTACNIPYYLTEIWKNKSVTLPTGVPLVHTWYSMMNLGALANFSADELTNLYPFLDTYGLNEPIARVGKEITYDYSKNAIHINKVLSTDACYLSNLSSALVGDKHTFFIKIKEFSSKNENRIISFRQGGTEVKLEIRDSTNLLYFGHIGDNAESNYPVTPRPEDGKFLNRKEPLVLALVFDVAAANMECWYDNDKPIEIATTGINLNGFVFELGSNAVPTTFSDYYLSEFFHVQKALSKSEIIATREWLNYR